MKSHEKLSLQIIPLFITIQQSITICCFLFRIGPYVLKTFMQLNYNDAEFEQRDARLNLKN